MFGPAVWTLDWLTFDHSKENANGLHIILTNETGFWSSPGVTVDKSQRVNAHGAHVGPAWKTERSIVLEGHAVARSDRDIKQFAAHLKGLCADPHKLYPLTCTSEIGGQTCGVRLDGDIKTTPAEDYSSSMSFSIQLVAPDPRIYDVEWQTMTTGLPRQTTGGLDFEYDSNTDNVRGLNFTSGLLFGSNTGQTGWVRLRNSGSAPAHVTYTLHGPLTIPKITNMTTGAVMQYNAELTAGEFVVITPSHPSVLLGGTATRRELLTPAAFREFDIPPATPYGPAGELPVGLTHSGPVTDSGRLTAEWRSASW